MLVGGLEKDLAEKTDKLEKSLTRLEDKAVTRFDVVTVVFAVFAAVGALIGTVLAIIS